MKYRFSLHSLLAHSFTFTSFLFLSTLTLFGQTPQSFSYQAVVRGTSGQLLSNQTISVRFNIRQGSANGFIIFTETHTTTTNDYGVFSLKVGSSPNALGDFNAIDWGDYDFFLDVGIDPNAGNSYTPLGTNQLLSVPYALYAKNVENKDDADPDPSNEFNKSFVLNGTMLDLTDGDGTLSVDLSPLAEDGDWVIDGTNVYHPGGSVGIGTNITTGDLTIGDYDPTSSVPSLDHQVYIGGGANSAYSQDAVKLYIGRYDNDGSSVFPIYVQDENNLTDFYLENRKSPGGDPSAFFAGSVRLKVLWGGSNNQVDLSKTNPTLAGGLGNSVDENYAALVGGRNNTASGVESFLGGGRDNVVTSANSAILGGFQNDIDSVASLSSIGGGFSNQVKVKPFSFLGGGIFNEIEGERSFIGSGLRNAIFGPASVVAGGDSNIVHGFQSGILGGSENVLSGDFGAVSGGRKNLILSGSSYGNVAGGLENIVAGDYAMIPGGRNNVAAGDYSFAGGQNSQANHAGSFVWSGTHSTNFASTTTNQFNVRATGGVRLVSGINGSGTAVSGVVLNAGSGTWSSLSDRNAKENIQPIDVQEILFQVNQLPLSRWNYISQAAEIQHIGPMAQDFHEAFGLGASDHRITTVDADGIALAAIQGLSQQMDAQEHRHQQEIEALKAEIEILKAMLVEQE